MKLLKPLMFVLLLSGNICNIRAQIIPGPSRNVSLELLFSADPNGGGTVIFPLKEIGFNAAKDTLIIEVYDQPNVHVPFTSLWGYMIYRNKADTTELYRLSAAFTNSPKRRAAIVSRQDGFIIYKETYDFPIQHYRLRETNNFYFSRFLYSDIHTLAYNDLSFIYDGPNPHFIKLVQREMNKWSLHTVNSKTHRLIITELYEQSLSDPNRRIISDTLLHHLRHSKADGNYALFHIQANQYAFGSTSGIFTTSFPFYQFDTVTGTKSNKQLTTTTDAFHQKPLFIDFSFEYNRFKNCFGLQLGFVANYKSALHVGAYYGYAFDIHAGVPGKIKFTIKPGISLSYQSYSELETSIDNENKYITAFNTTFNPTFVISEHHRSDAIVGGYNTYSYHAANKLNVYYTVKCLSLCPMLTIANNRRQRVYYALNLGWNIPFLDKSSLTLVQTGSSLQTSVEETGKKITILFNNPSLVSTKNGNSIFKAPFNSGGAFIGFSFGVYLNR